VFTSFILIHLYPFRTDIFMVSVAIFKIYELPNVGSGIDYHTFLKFIHVLYIICTMFYCLTNIHT
jgi:hypothetical protein